MGVRREKWRSGGGFFHPGPPIRFPAGNPQRPRGAVRGPKCYSVRPTVSQPGPNPPPQSRGDRVAVGALMGNTAAGVLAVERTTLTNELRCLRAQLRGGSSGPPAAGG